MEGENGDRGQEGAEQRWRQERKKARGDPRPPCPAGEPMTGGQGHARGVGVLRDTKGKQTGSAVTEPLRASVFPSAAQGSRESAHKTEASQQHGNLGPALDV